MAEEGKYLTSFLEIFINTDKELNNLALLEPGEQGAYFHEYLHYIQDITTCSGLSKIWNSFDRFRRLVASIQRPEITEVFVPLEGALADEQRANINFLKELRGSGQIIGIGPEVADTYWISEIEFQDDPKIAEYFPRSRATKIRLHLVSEGNPNKLFTFGEAAISETMAYLLERKFYPELNILPRYPYQVAHSLVEFMYPELLQNEENLFALCDVSLMHNMPGWAFVEILKKLKREGINPNSGEEIIELGYKFYEANEWDFTTYMRLADESLQHISSQLFANEHFEPTKILFQASIERGRILREECPNSVLNIYKADRPLSFNFYKVFNFLGGPHAVNRNGNRVVRVPTGLENLADIVHPQHFRVIWQLNKFLMEGRGSCTLYYMCVAAENIVPVDDRCEHSPWRRAEDEQGCPYAAFWTVYGFHEKDFYLNGVMIQQGNP
jgi:hypothetical protein